MEKYGELLQTLLSKRGITDALEADIFLNPDYARDMHDPFLMPDMDKACERIKTAIEKDEKIIIYADYDCDGIPGAVILQDLFNQLKYKNYEVYIPKRNSEGYGLNMEAIEQFVNSDAKLLITIDLGITAIEEVKFANKNKIDVIVTDHHLPHEILPEAFAILNPKVGGYPEKMLCGAGVVFKLCQAFLKKYGKNFDIREGNEKWLMDMAGLATLSDMVPLTGENRAIAYFGMKVLKRSPRPGLQKLLAKLNIDQRFLTEDDIGFMVTPRLNAASRMDDPMRAYELLSTTDHGLAGVLAEHLSRINDERKNIVKGIMREVNKKFEKTEDIKDKNVIVVGHPSWRVGVLGLVASKLCDQYKKPVFVWGKDENDCIKGSCRSDGSVSVVELMTDSKDHFSEFGGHELAGGFTVHADKIHYLEDALSGVYGKLRKDKKENGGEYDVKSDLSLVSMKSWKDIEKLAPFGFSNPKPTFFFESLKIEEIKKFGKNGSGEHLEITFSDANKKKTKAVSFFSTTESFKAPILPGGHANLLATFDLSRFRGKEELRLRVVDII